MAALALRAVGVLPEAVVADYAATGERISEIIRRLRRSQTYPADINSKPPEAHRPRAETMAAFLEQLDSRHGGAASWLAAHGFGDGLPELWAKLR